MGRLAGEEDDDDWDLLDSETLRELSPLLNTCKHGLFQRIDRQRAAYFADIGEGQASSEDEERSDYQMGGCEKGSADGAGSAPSGFADLSTWCYDVFMPARSAQMPQAERQARLVSIADQPTHIMLPLGPRPIHPADLPTEPLLSAAGASARSTQAKRPQDAPRGFCRRFLRTCLRCLYRVTHSRMKRVAVSKEHEQQAMLAKKDEKRTSQVRENKQQQGLALKSQAQGPAVPKKDKQRLPGAGDDERQGLLIGGQRKRLFARKGNDLLLERLREREQRGAIPRTLRPPALRPARVSRPPTDNLFS
ncbi:MAG TPA: hypothetical protein VGD98_06920 [Ktedonobacteraceae bacterium]